MGYDATNILPKDTNIKNIEELLILLKYEKISQDKIDRELKAKPFFHFNEENYSSFTGIQAFVYKRSDNQGINVEYHTRIWASKYEIDYINFTIKTLKRYFGGHFTSDFGKNRYLKFDDHIRIKAEAGCYLAYQNFVWNIQKTEHLAELMKKNKFEFPKIPSLKMFSHLKDINPNTIAPNLIIPFLVAIMEEYFRATYIALMKYSESKTRIIKRATLTEEDIERIIKKEISLEESASRWKNFQDLGKVNQNFKEVDNKLDLFGKIKKGSKNKESKYEAIQKFIKLRHFIIHNSEIDIDYNISKSIEDIRLLKEAISLIYHSLTLHYKWVYDPV